MSPFRLAGGRNAVAWRGERGPVGEQQESGQAPSQHFSEEWPWDWHVEVEQSAPAPEPPTATAQPTGAPSPPWPSAQTYLPLHRRPPLILRPDAWTIWGSSGPPRSPLEPTGRL